MEKTFHERIIELVGRIPEGRVATYGQLAAMAGNPRGARQVARVLHASSDKEKLPWHRVINARGRISLPRMAGFELQKALLEDEGVTFGNDEAVDLVKFRWSPR